jgi:GSCFA family
MTMFSIKAFFPKKKISPSWSRIPEAMRVIAQAGEYLRVFPYPVERIVGDYESRPFITKDTKIITMGSCFAQELYQWLLKNGFNCLDHEWGVIYSPKSISQIIQYSFERDRWTPDEPTWCMDSKYYFPYLKSADHSGPMLLGESMEEARTALEGHYQRSKRILQEADLAVWTLGLTELWRSKKSHCTYFAIPYPQIFDADVHEFHSLSYSEVIDELEYAINTYKSNNEKIKIMLSVSPIPLSISFRSHLGPFVATQYSKSILHAAALELSEKYDFVFYMPSYEIVRNDPRASYSEDGRHVNRTCVNTIMSAFKTLYVIE